MIDTVYLANLVQGYLNANELSKKFLVFADEGDMKKAVCKGNYKEEYTHCVIETISDNVVPFENLEFQTINTRLMLFVDLISGGKVLETELNREQSRNLIQVKSCVDAFLLAVNGKSTYIEDDGKIYNLTITMSKPTNGQKMSLGEIVEGLPIYCSVQFTIFQNGLNSNDCKIKVNGESLGYTQLVKTKNCTANQSNLGNEGARAYILAGGKSFDAVVPLLSSGVTQEFVEFMLGDSLNTAFDVELEYPNIKKHLICVLGKVQETDARGTNVALNISLLQGVEDILNYDDRWTIIETDAKEYTIATLQLGDVVYWGDKTYSVIEKEEDKTHAYTDEEKEHTIRIFRGSYGIRDRY